MSQKKICNKGRITSIAKKNAPTFFRELMALEEKSNELVFDINLQIYSQFF